MVTKHTATRRTTGVARGLVALIAVVCALTACDAVLGIGDYRERGADAGGPADVAALTTLTASTGTLNPSFDPTVLSYTLVPPATGWFPLPFTVTPTAPANATVTVKGTAVVSGTPSLPVAFALSPTPIDIAVTSLGGAVTHYTLVVPIVEEAYVKASNTRTQAELGTSVALSSDGNTMAVGSPRESSAAKGINGNQGDETATAAGAVYIFSRSGTTWSQEAYIKASNSRVGAYFGTSVALSSDGDTLAVGSPAEKSAARGLNGDQNDTSAPSPGPGAVYVYSRRGTRWSQQAYGKASNLVPTNFGEVVALSADGNTMAVGCVNELSAATGINGNQSDTSAPMSGAVYVFFRTIQIWQGPTYVKASNTRSGASFGSAVALSADGNTMAVGSAGESSAATGTNGNQSDTSASGAGAVYVFSNSVTGWSQQAYVKASNPRASQYWNFGSALALSSDGKTLAVGSREDSSAATGINGNQNDTSTAAAGAVYVLSLGATGWSQQAYVKASSTRPSAYFGFSVALSSNGNTMAVRSFNESAVFSRSGTAWSQRAHIDDPPAHAEDATFGQIALSSDGTTVAVGSASDPSAAKGINGNQSDTKAPRSGAVFIFR